MLVREAVSKVKYHRKAVFLALLIIGILFNWFLPWHMTTFEFVVFWLFSLVGFDRRSKGSLRYLGFGVAKEINRIAGMAVVDDYGDPIRWILAPPPLFRMWYQNTGVCVLMAAFGSGMYLWRPDITEDIFHFAVVYSVANLLSHLGELYEWFVADRYFLWYFHEKLLRMILEKKELSDVQINDIVRQAYAENLLLGDPH